MAQLESQAAGAIPTDLVEGHRSGYVWTLTGSPTGYTVSAVPELARKAGTRTFFADQTFVIRSSYLEKPATASSPPLGVPTAQ